MYGCNHACTFCHERENIYSYNFRNISLDDLENIYIWLQKNGFDYVIISWGEPSLHPDFVDIILFFQSKWIYVVVVSNGSHIDTHDLQRIDREKITFYISYHGQKEQYNTITQSSDFDRVSENIQLLSSMFPEVILRYVVNKKNIERFQSYSEYVFQRFPEVFLEYVLVEDLRYAHVQDTFIPLEQFYNAVLKYIHQDNVLLDGGAACFHSYLFEHAQSKFDPLVNTMIGLVKKDKENNILYSIKQEQSQENIKMHWSKCKNCVKFRYCHGFDIDYVKKNG